MMSDLTTLYVPGIDRQKWELDDGYMFTQDSSKVTASCIYGHTYTCSKVGQVYD